MARYSQRPENALKRANEFIEVGKPARALDTLQEVFRNKKWTYTWSESVLEPIMFKYLDLCVELKKSHIAKEGLFQYRNMFQSVNVGSLENVIRGYLRMAEEKTEAAKAQSAQAVIDIDDLDNLATPESILLSAVSGEDAQDRSDRTILTPWVKFLWESYCQCLELLRTNAHVESLYHDIARMAFQFCLGYSRKTEFRKLCDKLRKHLEDICKLPPQQANVSIAKPETQQLNLDTRLVQLDSAIQMELWQFEVTEEACEVPLGVVLPVSRAPLYHDVAGMAFQFCLGYSRKTEFRKLCDKLRKHLEDICKLPPQQANVSIAKPETQQLNLDTRLVQLDSAIQMELWQEAYKAIEDIHGLMNMSKKMPVPKTMANYYQKLAMVFWKAGNQLFHAAALFKLFQLSKEMKKNITPEELQRMACRVLIATLAIPLPSAHPEFDRFIETDKTPLEKAQRLAVLLGLLQPPTRASLLKDIVRVNVVNLASPQLQDLYNWLEVEFHPLLLSDRVQIVIDGIKAEEGSPLQQYIPALQDVTLVRLIRQVAQVYQTIEFTRLLELAKFTTAFHLERILVDCVRHNDMQIRIDHGHSCIHFGMDLSESQREDKPEGPTLQSMPSEQIRNQLVNMAGVLYRAIDTIYPNKKKAEREKLRAQMVQHYHENKVKEHQRILQRHKIIEDRKEYIERLNTVREEEELRRQEELQRQQMLAEQKRLEQEREERERKRQQNEIQQIKDRHLKEKMQQISQTSHGQKVLKKLDEDEIKKLDAEQIAAREAEELQKEKRELQAKLKSQEKKVDYFERAKRLEEIPLLQKSMEEKQVQDQKFWEQQESERIAAAVEERRLAVANRERLQRMKPDKEAFLTKLKSERNIVYEDKLREFEKLLEDERKKRLAQRKITRKEERRQKWAHDKEAEAERKKEEEIRRIEEERRKKEEDERKEKEERLRIEREEQEKKEKDHIAMMERVAAKQRQREEEIERRLQEEQATTRETTSSWRRGDPIERPDRERPDRERPERPERPERERPERSERPERAPEKDKPREESSWRKAGDEPKKAEPWRGSRLRESDAPKASEAPSAWRTSDDRGSRPGFDRGGFDRDDRERNDRRDDRPERERPERERPERERPERREERRDGARDGGRFGDRGGDRFGRDTERDRRGEDRRDGGDRGSSWRSKVAENDEERVRRPGPPVRSGPKEGSDWRSKESSRRDEGPRREEGPRRGPEEGPRRGDGPREERNDRGPRRDAPRDKPRDSQPVQEEDGTWQVANRRR